MYADFKHIDPVKHKNLCGMDNAVIKDNLIRVDEVARKHQVRLVVRIPVIPGINDDSVTLHATGAFLANLENLDHVQFLPYHRLGVDTYRKLGRPYPLEDIRYPDAERMEQSRDLIRAYVRNVV